MSSERLPRPTGGAPTDRTPADTAAGICGSGVRHELETTIRDGYRRTPDAPTDHWLEAATKAMVLAEPW